MKYLGLMQYFLSEEVLQGDEKAFICQSKYVKNMLNKYGMKKYKPIQTPVAYVEMLRRDDGAEKANENLYRSIFGSLMFLTTTRHDIAYAISLVSRNMNEHLQNHMKATT